MAVVVVVAVAVVMAVVARVAVAVVAAVSFLLPHPALTRAACAVMDLWGGMSPLAAAAAASPPEVAVAA
jgi:hypothetical protein